MAGQRVEFDIFRLILTIVSVVAAHVLFPAVSLATPGEVSQYGQTALPGTYVTECGDCHVYPESSDSSSCGSSSGSQPWAPCLNPFGIEYRTSGWSSTVEDADADGDGENNGIELDNDPRSAGFPTGAEAAGCQMLTCASNSAQYVNCGSSNIQCRALRIQGPGSSGQNAFSYNYSFSFRCITGASPAPVNGDTNWNDRCLDINECAGNPCGVGTCSQLALGNGWFSPGYQCTCPQGYTSSGTTCVNVNECTSGTDDCEPGSTCTDTIGGFVCEPAAANEGSCFPVIAKGGRTTIVCL